MWALASAPAPTPVSHTPLHHTQEEVEWVTYRQHNNTHAEVHTCVEQELQEKSCSLVQDQKLPAITTITSPNNASWLLWFGVERTFIHSHHPPTPTPHKVYELLVTGVIER